MAQAPTTNDSTKDKQITLEEVANRIKSGKIKKISILAGAGISVSAGIPDFRSKDGFYNTLDVNKYDLTPMQKVQVFTDPQYILTRELFDQTPIPYFQARRDFILSPLKYKATKTHWFFRLLYEKNLLKRFYSTNIDGLDLQTQYYKIKNEIKYENIGCFDNKPCLIHVHGTLGTASCIKCHRNVTDMAWYRNQVLKENYPIKCEYNDCNDNKNWIKPGTVLFGESLPKVFFDTYNHGNDMNDVNLMIIAGTSLTVSPSCSIPDSCNDDSNKCIKLYINKDISKRFYNKFDLCIDNDCDTVCSQLIKLLNWENDMKELIEKYGENNERNNNDINQSTNDKSDNDRKEEKEKEKEKETNKEKKESKETKKVENDLKDEKEKQETNNDSAISAILSSHF